MLLDTARILRHGHALGAARLGVVDDAVADAQGRRQQERRVRRDEAVGERPGDRDRLEGRTWFVGVDDGLVALVGRLVAERVGVHQRHVGDGVDLAGLWVLDDRGAALGVELAHGVGQHPVRLELDAAVERQADVLPRGGLDRLDGAQRLARRILHDHLVTGPAGELPVVAVLHAGQAVAVGAGEAYDLRGRGVERIDALLLDVAAHAGQIERRRLVGEGGIGLTRDVGEPALAILDLLIHVAVLQLEHEGELVGGLARVAEHVRRRVDGLGRLVDGKLDAVAVEDRAAVGRQRHRPHLLLAGDRGEVALAHRDGDGLAADRQEGDHEDHAQQAHAPVERAAHGRRVGPATARAVPRTAVRLAPARPAPAPGAARHSVPLGRDAVVVHGDELHVGRDDQVVLGHGEVAQREGRRERRRPLGEALVRGLDNALPDV